VSAVIDFELKFDRYRFVVAVTPTGQCPMTSSFVLETLLQRLASVAVIALRRSVVLINLHHFDDMQNISVMLNSANGVFSEIRRHASEA